MAECRWYGFVKFTLFKFNPPMAVIQFPDVLRRGGFPIIALGGITFGTRRRLLGPGSPLSDNGSGEKVDKRESHSEKDGLCNGGKFAPILITLLGSLKPYSDSVGLAPCPLKGVNPRLTVDVCGAGDVSSRTFAAKDKLELVDGLLLKVAMPPILLLLPPPFSWGESVNNDMVELMLGDLLKLLSSIQGDKSFLLI